MNHHTIPAELELKPLEPGVCSNGEWAAQGEELLSTDPTTSKELARVVGATPEDTLRVIQGAQSAFESWKKLPAPRRGEYVRLIGEELRRYKKPLGKLVSLECGKILSEGEGEVQEMIDIADFAVGLSRTIGGATLPSERPEHRMFEQWHPLGPVGVITAFNFPVAVWSWNALVAAICGDTVIWKPSEKTPLSAVAVQKICNKVLEPEGFSGVFNLCAGGRETGAQIAVDERLPLISATGSCRMGREVGTAVAARMGRSLLELGGNNAVIVLDDADLDLALRAVLFGSLGTAGQRCTTTRRVRSTTATRSGSCISVPTIARGSTNAAWMPVRSRSRRPSDWPTGPSPRRSSATPTATRSKSSNTTLRLRPGSAARMPASRRARRGFSRSA